MKRKFFVVALSAVAVGAMGFLGISRNGTESEISLNENVEALASGESSESSCSGYRSWSTHGDDEKEFYDCMCVLRSGFFAIAVS